MFGVARCTASSAPNGAGKTTTLRMLVGLVRPSAGTARVAGFEPGAPSGLARIGCLVENPAFYPYLSGRDNLRVVARFCGVPYARVEQALSRWTFCTGPGTGTGPTRWACASGWASPPRC